MSEVNETKVCVQHDLAQAGAGSLNLQCSPRPGAVSEREPNTAQAMRGDRPLFEVVLSYPLGWAQPRGEGGGDTGEQLV